MGQSRSILHKKPRLKKTSDSEKAVWRRLAFKCSICNPNKYILYNSDYHRYLFIVIKLSFNELCLYHKKSRRKEILISVRTHGFKPDIL